MDLNGNAGANIATPLYALDSSSTEDVGILLRNRLFPCHEEHCSDGQQRRKRLPVLVELQPWAAGRHFEAPHSALNP